MEYNLNDLKIREVKLGPGFITTAYSLISVGDAYLA
jgi:hypothetical protein